MSDQHDSHTPAHKGRTTIKPGEKLLLSREYTILSKIGEGGMGEVVLVTSPFINQDFEAAMKILDKNDMVSEDSLERFHREAELLSIASHPNIAKFIEYFESDSYAYLVMEYVLGQDLEEFVEAQGGKLEPRLILDIVLDILEALIYMYEEHGMSHRDLKPPNILVRKNKAHITKERLYRGILIDFGNTKIIESQAKEPESLTMMSGTMTGTPGYTAPSVTLDIFDEKDDVFSLGATVMFGLLGYNPFEIPGDMQASMFKILNQEQELKLGEFEGTAIGSWIRINVSPNIHDRFTLRQSYNVLSRIRENPLRETSENFLRTIASDDALVQLTEKVDALHDADDMNTMATGLMELGFEASWLNEALAVGDAQTGISGEVGASVEKEEADAPENALIDSLLKKKSEEKTKDPTQQSREDQPQGSSNGLLLLLILLILGEAGAIIFLALR